MDKAELQKLFLKAKESIDLISPDKKELQKWKKEKRNLFLQFVPSIKELIMQFNSYIKAIEPELNTIYTTEISQEISEIANQTEQIINNSSVNDDSSSQQNLNLISENTNENINKNTATDNLSEYESEELIKLIEYYLNELKTRDEKWSDKSNDIIKRLEEDKNKLKETENNIKNILSELTTQRSLYLRNKQVLEIHLNNNQKIVRSIPNLKISIENRIKNITDDLFNLDQEIKHFISREQEITEKFISQPYTLD